MSTEAMKHLIQCLVCGAANRVAVHRLQLGFTPVCGKCKSPLPDIKIIASIGTGTTGTLRKIPYSFARNYP